MDTLNLPESPDEPKPWTVSIWRYHHEVREPYATRDAAIAAALETIEVSEDMGLCAVDGVYRPDGTLDEDAQRILRPYDYRENSEPTYAN